MILKISLSRTVRRLLYILKATSPSKFSKAPVNKQQNVKEIYQSCQRHSYFCKQKLTAPPCLAMYVFDLNTFSGTEREQQKEKEKENGKTIKGPPPGGV